jgi:CHAT domain-containing protein/tetratricopeptide (TPR) repeat protein
LASKKLNEQMETASNQGWAALESGEWDVAEQAYDAAIKAARELGDKVAEALFRGYRGEARRGQGRTDDARVDIEHSLALAQSEGCAQIIAHSQFLLSELDTDAGDVSKAIDRLVKSLDAALACSDSVTAEVAFGKLGLLYLELGWLEPASECFRQALEQSADGPNRASWLGNLGQSLAEMGQMEESIGLYRQALEQAKTDGDTRAQAKCLASEGLSHFQQERYNDSLDCFKQALALSHADTDLSSKSTWLGNLGNVFLRLGQTDEASEFAHEGLALAQKLKDRHSEAAHLDTIGDCLLHKGQYEEALKHYSSALEIGKSIADKIGERIYLSNVARAYKRLGQSDKAIESFRQAIEIFDEQRSRINADSLKTSFAATGQSLYRDTIHACLEAGRRVEALEYVGRAKSRAILDLLRNSPIDITELHEVKDEGVAKLVAREQELSRQIARLERIYWQGPMDSDPTGHRGAATVTADDAPRLYNEWREVVDQLKRRHRNYATMVAVDTLNFGELRALWGSDGRKAALPRETAIIEFFLTDEFLFTAAVWSGCDQPAIEVTLDSKELADLLTDIADFLEMSSTEGWEVPVSLCKRLHHRLMSTVCSALPDWIERLILVPHGVLHRVPFAALHDGDNYLIERYSMSYLPTSSLIPVLSGANPEHAEDLRYLVSAISDYSATRSDGIVFSSRLRSAAGLEDLSYVLEEGKTVHKLATQHVTDARLLTNDEVKDGLLSMFSSYNVVHFAGHAVFNPEEPLASGLVLADGSILTAARILQDNALRTKCGKLLVLSACQTGVNVITNGGEILGLARALMYAGMPNLILSLWEVADRSTAELMQYFHDAWQGGKVTIAEALAAAQRKAARENQPIHAWAPFVHLGIE